MGKGSAPSAPDPYATAAAQYQYGTAAANYGTALNRPNVATPYGDTNWYQTPQPVNPGYTSTPTSVPNPSTYTGFFNGVPGGGGPPMSTIQPISPGNPGTAATGGGGGFASTRAVGPNAFGLGGPAQAGDITARPAAGGGAYTPPNGNLPGPGGYGAVPAITPPNYTEQFNLSPAEQSLFNLNQIGELGVGGTSAGAAATGGYKTSVPGASDIPAFTTEAQRAAYNQQTQYLDPQFQQQYEQLDAQLRNSGAHPGDPAYDNQMKLFENQRQQAYTNAFNNSVGAGLSEQQALFGESLGGAEFGNQAIEGGLAETGFGGAPSFGLGGGGGGGSVSAPDIMSAFQNQYAGSLANYNANVATTNADTSALASLAALYFLA